MIVAALETRSTLPDGTRIWHVVRTAVPKRAIETVKALEDIGRFAVVELTGSSFHYAADDAPQIWQAHKVSP